MDVDGPSPGEDFRFDEDKDDEEEMYRLWPSPSSTALYRQGRKYQLLYRHQTLPPPLLNPLSGETHPCCRSFENADEE